MVANDWDLVDPLQNNKIVAHARGLHIQASRGEEQCWHTSFDIVFEEGSGSLEGSTLQVMGPGVVIDGEWSIVGGTGKLTLARGIIYKTTQKEYDNGGEAIADLDIHAFYIPMERLPNRYVRLASFFLYYFAYYAITSIPIYKSFDFFDSNCDHSFYSKKFA
ncbi:hypothetical protein HU200_027878 [Digitaria exilis]|uniref:Dirigent protein n=1 Tax=Digitaria exilis TaxID=1010633 RepID=A0A835C471_9POAL|nr:hypothetical protein HU200_027878 [Digitaria exilis]